jgi:hypothetical protein
VNNAPDTTTPNLSWNAPDASPQNGSGRKFLFSYSNPGTYTLTLNGNGYGSGVTATVSVSGPPTAGSCVEDPLTVCLIGGRYKVTSHWKNQYAGGAVFDLNKTRLTDAIGAFWLSDSSSFEYLIRIETATDNGHAWISIPMLTDVEFWVDVTDTAVNGQVKEYHSAPGNKIPIYDPLFFVYP